MKNNYLYPLLTWLFVAQVFVLSAQQNIITRTVLDPDMAPFYHGVASGDPLADRVIIWTRLTPDVDTLPYDVDWEVATDMDMTNVVQSGTYTTDASKDFTVKIDVSGLQQNSWYYYRFENDGSYSLTGRTRTAPSGLADSARFAIVSCSDYSEGYFHAYHKITERNDIDAVIHLGDYIYEGGSAGDIGWPHDPPKRISALSDYRQRYSQYRLDNDLRCLHQMYPFINVWDDHEIANNTWTGGSDSHDPNNDGLWEVRKRMAVQAFFEWTPIRMPEPTDTFRIYRKIEWGGLVDLLMIDSRLIGRDLQDENATTDTSRYMLGRKQLAWLADELKNSTTQWRLIGQQVLMAPLNASFLQSVVDPFLADTWDGYKAERQRLYDTILDYNVDNVVVLTGDIHTAWANNLVDDGGDNVAVEFVVSSVTKQNAGAIGQLGALGSGLVQSFNDHIEFVDFVSHGYYILDVNNSRTQADFYFVDDIKDSTKSEDETLAASWMVNDGSATLSSASGAATRDFIPEVPASNCGTILVGINEDVPDPDATVIGTYPNPFWDDFVVKTYLFKTADVSIMIFDQQGKLVKQVEGGELGSGLHYIPVDGNDLPNGMYLINVQVDDQRFVKRTVKI